MNIKREGHKIKKERMREEEDPSPYSTHRNIKKQFFSHKNCQLFSFLNH